MNADKVTHKLPAPTKCDCCGSVNIIFREKKGYRKQLEKDPWFWAWCCNDCNASVGTHSGTFIPFGYMANSATRVMRAKVHVEFDKLWREGSMTRDEAYNWLARELNIKRQDCHIGLLSGAELTKTYNMVAGKFKELERIYARRKQKRIESDIKRSERSLKRCGLRLAVGKQ